MRVESKDLNGWVDLARLARDHRRLDVLRLTRTSTAESALSILAWWVVATAVVVAVLRGAFVETFVIPSGSMAPTLRVNDYILVPKFLYGLHLPLIEKTLLAWGAPNRGDVIVFNHSTGRTGAGDSFALVKRVIAREGDTVEVLGRSVYLNGKVVVEPYARWSGLTESSERVGPFVVPRGKVFVLGDNRANSEDSRAWSDPFVPISSVIGKAVAVYWSDSTADRAGTLL
jgi:signal peptidase I